MPVAAPSAAEAAGAALSGAPAPPLSDGAFAALMAPLGPFGPAPVLAAGVSGGPHSLALALLGAAWARARGGRLVALVCDHGLRAGSAAEAAQVAAMLAARGIAARVLALGLPPGPGLQARARAARLGALLEAAAAEGAPWLLLGQHRGDQAETLLARALAGSGPAGLSAMAPARAAPQALLLRPLLGVPAARLEATVAAAGLVPLRDPSNAESRFGRVRLRGALADPDGQGPGIAALAEAATRFAARRRARQSALAARLAAAAALRPEGFARLDLGALGRDGVAVAALAALLRAVGGRDFAPAEAAVAALLARGQGSLGGAVLRRDGLLLREAAAIGPDVAALPGAVWDGRFRLVGPGDPQAVIGALGADAAGLRLPASLPPAVARTLPAIRRGGALVAVPALGWPGVTDAGRFEMVFAPRAGPAA